MSSSRSWSSTSKRSSGGSRRAERKPRARSLGSPKISPPSTTQSNDLKITIKSVMEGVHGAKVLVPSTCNVSELKTIVADATDVSPEKQLLLYNNKELKNNDESIQNYGITSDCTITMNVKMNTGSKISRQQPASVSMLFLPLMIQQGSISNLRNHIRSMTSVTGRPEKAEKSKEITTTWSPAMQLEHEITRNRMKRLMRKRKNKKFPSDSSSSTESASSYKSPAVSPLCSTTNSDASISQANDGEINEKQLQVFFDPPESVEEMLVTSSVMVMPPANMDELMKIKAKRKESAKTVCMFCFRKVTLPEQHIQCLCKQIFCRKHRQPSAHYCSIDYRQKGRTKISKENPKIPHGGYHKAKQQ